MIGAEIVANHRAHEAVDLAFYAERKKRGADAINEADTMTIACEHNERTQALNDRLQFLEDAIVSIDATSPSGALAQLAELVHVARDMESLFREDSKKGVRAGRKIRQIERAAWSIRDVLIAVGADASIGEPCFPEHLHPHRMLNSGPTPSP